MSQLKLSGDASGTGIVTVAAPNTNSTYTVTLPAAAGTLVNDTGGQTVQFALGSASTPSVTFTGDTNTGVFSSGADTVNFATGGAEAARINSSGTLILKGGSTSATGVGITFPADTTTTVSSNANTLDDYEEGTFTPTARGATTAGTTTYTNQYGHYTKIGRSVTVVILVQWSAMTGTGILTIGGLPFASANNTQNYALGAVTTYDLNWTGGTMMTAFQELNTTDITLIYSSDDAPSDRQLCVNESAVLRITVTYFA